MRRDAAPPTHLSERHRKEVRRFEFSKRTLECCQSFGTVGIDVVSYDSAINGCDKAHRIYQIRRISSLRYSPFVLFIFGCDYLKNSFTHRIKLIISNTAAE